MVAQAPLVASLPPGRLSMELGALLAYGGAARSLELLWRHGMLHLLLPHHAAYLKVCWSLCWSDCICTHAYKTVYGMPANYPNMSGTLVVRPAVRGPRGGRQHAWWR